MPHPKSLICFAALGVAISVAIAWGCAWTSVLACENVVDVSGRDAASALRHFPGAAPADFASTWRGFGVREHRVYMTTIATPDGAIESDAAQGREALRARLRDSLPPDAPDADAFMSYRDWTGTRRIPPDADTGFVHVCRRRAGWPLLCMEQWWNPWSDARNVFEYSVAGQTPTLPLVPIPLGLAANSAFHAGVVAAIWAAWRGITRRRRRRAGRCPECGYEISESGTCPECGMRLRQ